MKRYSTWRPKGIFQIMMLGNAEVGKSSLLLRFVADKAPTLSEPMATVGAEFRVKTVCLVDGVVKLQIWDTSGQKRFRELLRSYYKHCSGAVVVYDIQNRKSFKEAQDWVTELRNIVSSELVIVLAGNKADMEAERKVTKFEAEEYALLNNLIFLETSSVTGLNVNNCFMEIAKAIYAQRFLLKQEKQNLNLKQQSNNNENEIKVCLCCFVRSQKEAPRIREKVPL